MGPKPTNILGPIEPKPTTESQARVALPLPMAPPNWAWAVNPSLTASVKLTILDLIRRL